MQRRFSRRAAIQGGLGVALIPLLSGGEVHAGRSSNSLAELEVISSSDETFSQLITQNYPGLLDSAAASLAPLFHVITNSGSSNVSAIAARWTFITATGKSEAFDVHVLPSVLGHWYTGNAALIPSQGLRLFSPFFSWSPGQYELLPRPLDWAKLLSSTEVTRFRSNSLMKSVQSGRMAIDAVIWDRRHIAGTDSSKLGHDFILTRNGEHDAAYAVHQLLLHGKTQAQIDQFLGSEFVGVTSEPRNRIYRRYRAARRRESGFLLSALRSQSAAEFQKTIAFIVRQPRTVLTAAKS